jgi:hypothetical protein
MNGVVGPVAPIIGAIIGATIAWMVTYYLIVKRKSLGFWVTKSEDLTTSLRRHHQQIIVSVGGQGFLNLNRATILVKNIGNTSIGDFKFDIEIPGDHERYLSDVVVADAELRNAIAITVDQPVRTFNPIFHIAVASFLNAGESFKIAVFFDGSTDQCNVRCRIADVRSKVRSGELIEFRDLLRERDLKVGLIAAILALIGILVLAALGAA